ncbi:hypothetical protein NCCP2716_28220 [Sporosarcina sp. NCCP-2716]|uniref:hypothetical protein n=1 Tax=Sporosarcina sp. NCCP-2716 TaxID=2943679 RepID=UPI00203E0AE3|nr:hypothetical protein [Sporosarcina sp. NCCP-2716]GKV70324.1 hypothetical protein NCCP2716_28220 [Sporosarcina sp. NCCP-2716]
MNPNELVRAVNACVEELDFVTARKYMEDNLDILKTHKHRLQRNAQELLEFVMHSDSKRLTQQEVKIIHALNDHASHFNIRSFKLLVKDHVSLMNREETQTYLNADAKALLSSMQGTHSQE